MPKFSSRDGRCVPIARQRPVQCDARGTSCRSRTASAICLMEWLADRVVDRRGASFSACSDVPSSALAKDAPRRSTNRQERPLCADHERTCARGEEAITTVLQHATIGRARLVRSACSSRRGGRARYSAAKRMRARSRRKHRAREEQRMDAAMPAAVGTGSPPQSSECESRQPACVPMQMAQVRTNKSRGPKRRLSSIWSVATSSATSAPGRCRRSASRWHRLFRATPRFGDARPERAHTAPGTNTESLVIELLHCHAAQHSNCDDVMRHSVDAATLAQSALAQRCGRSAPFSCSQEARLTKATAFAARSIRGRRREERLAGMAVCRR